MKIITIDEMGSYSTKLKSARGTSECKRELVAQMMILKVGEGVQVLKSEWCQKTAPGFTKNEFPPKLFRVRSLLDGMGWVVRRVA